MRIGLIAYLLHSGGGYRSAGVSTYIAELLRSLPTVAPEHDYVAFHGRHGGLPKGVSSAISPVDTSRALMRIAWEQSGLVAQLMRSGCDLVHGLVNVVPLAAHVPRVTTVHDLAFLRHPERFSRSKVMYLQAAVKASMLVSRHVIAVSENTRTDLIELLRVPEHKLSVVYPGVADRFKPLPVEEVVQFQRMQFSGRPYILHVGTLEPRKNIDVLIRAFARLRASSGLPHVLALVGARGWMYSSLFTLVTELGLDDSVQFIDFVPSTELPLWYNGAELFAFPSAYEGFGLPVVEAMACGVPTITTSGSSLGEIAGDACLTVEPGSVESLSMAIACILNDSSLRRTLAQRGIERAAHFRWRETALRSALIYESVLGTVAA